MKVPSLKDLQVFIDAVKNEPFLFFDRMTPEKLKKLCEDKSCWFMQYPSGEIFASVALWGTSSASYIELGSLWVKKEHREAGLGISCISHALGKAGKGKTVFLVSANPIVSRQAESLGFDEHVDWQESRQWVPLYRHQQKGRAPKKDARLFYKMT